MSVLTSFLIVQQTGRPAAALYVYSKYSPFEDVVNVYMSEGLPIVPPTSSGQLTGLLANHTLNSARQNLLRAGTPISAVQGVVLLDQQR